MKVLLFASTLVNLISTGTASVPISEFYPFGSNVGDVDFPKNDDGSSPIVHISSLFPFFNNQHDSLYVNTNGAISFQQTLRQFTPDPFPLNDGRRIIAPFWADVDTTKGGTVWYRETTNDTLLRRATEEIKFYYPSQVHFHASWVFIATWDKVAFYGTNDIGRNKRNTFQAVLITNGRHSFTIFNYNAIQWTTGTASDGNATTGLGGIPAQVGFNGGDGINYFVLNQSRTDSILQLASLSNVGLPGKFIFRVDTANIEHGGCNTGGTLTVTPRFIPMFGGKLITLAGPCIQEGDSTKIAFGTGGFSACVQRSNFSVQCSTPMFYTTGDINVHFTVTAQNQNVTTYLGLITLLNPIQTPPALIRLDPESWKKNSVVEIDWKDEDLPFSTDEATLDIYVLKRNNFGRPSLYLHKNIPISKTFVLDVDVSGAVIRMSASNQDQLTQSVWSDVFYVKSEQKATTVESCLLWQEREKQFIAVNILEVQECPCSLDQAIIDVVRFHDDPNCHQTSSSFDDIKIRHINCIHHPNAERCFRLNVPGPRNTGRLCCYNNNGNLMDAGSPEGGGTLHRHHYEGGPTNIPYLSHFMDDLTPYLHCCVHGTLSTCNQYLARRPKGDCRKYVPVTIGLIGGDPHFTTFDGLDYTFNGVGEFTLLKTTNDNFMAQVRLEHFKDENGVMHQASVMTSFAAQSVNISDKVEVQLNTIRTADLLINGELIEIDSYEASTLSFKGISVSSSTDNGTDGSLRQFKVIFKNPQFAFRVLAYKTMINVVILTGTDKLQGQIEGLLGNKNGDKKDDLRTPNGSVLSFNETMEMIHQEVGLKWRTQENESLFTYPYGKTHSDYQNINFTPLFDIQIPSEEAREICGIDTPCLYDYIATGGNVGIARSTKDFFKTFAAMKKKHMAVNRGSNVRGWRNTYFGLSPTTWRKIDASTIEVTSCGFPRDVENGYWNSTGLTQSATATLVCNDGYSPTSTESITCNNIGEWTFSSTATCEVTNQEPIRTSRFRPLVIGISTGACIVLLALIFGYVCLKRRTSPNTPNEKTVQYRS